MYKIVRFLLNDGTFLKASIFNDREKESIQNVEEIDAKFLGNDMIAFQTDVISGHFHPSNVLWYQIIYDN